MAKNILVITGSPRKNGNTDVLAEAFIKGARGAGHSVEKFEAGFADIAGCTACDACWSAGTPCAAYSDDFDKLAPMLERADTLVLATPLYWFDFSAQIKAAIDRMYAYVMPPCPRPLKIRDAVLLVAGAEKDESTYDGVVSTYVNILKYLKWNDKGVLIAAGAWQLGDMEKTDYPARAEKLGAGV